MLQEINILSNTIQMQREARASGKIRYYVSGSNIT